MDSTARFAVASAAINDGISRELALDACTAEPRPLLVKQAMMAAGLGALTQLLVETAVIDADDFANALADHAEYEVIRLESVLTEATGEPVSLSDPECRRP